MPPTVALVLAAVLFAAQANARPNAELRCQLDQLRAASILCRSSLQCEAGFVRSVTPNVAARRDECIERARSSFESRYKAARGAAVRRGGQCALDEAAADVSDALAEDALAIGSDVLEGANPASSSDRALRASLLSAAARLCSTTFKVERSHALRPRESLRVRSQGRARERFDGLALRAIERAEKRGVQYDGKPVHEVGDALESAAWNFSLLSSPDASHDSVAGAIADLAAIMDQYHDRFPVYSDVSSSGNHFHMFGKIPAGAPVTVNGSDDSFPHSCATALRFSFVPTEPWGGFYMMNGVLPSGETAPRVNFGEIPNAGVDLTGARRLTFWARGAQGHRPAAGRVRLTDGTV
jgi:hypothetical protein